MNKTLTLLTTIMALAATFGLSAQSAQEAVDKFVSNSSLRYASVGVQVIDLDSARSIASYRPEQANITASTMKTVVSMSKRLDTMARAVPHCPAPVSVVRVWIPASAL